MRSRSCPSMLSMIPNSQFATFTSLPAAVNLDAIA
jgi:hypothetical protein